MMHLLVVHMGLGWGAARYLSHACLLEQYAIPSCNNADRGHTEVSPNLTTSHLLGKRLPRLVTGPRGSGICGYFPFGGRCRPWSAPAANIRPQVGGVCQSKIVIYPTTQCASKQFPPLLGHLCQRLLAFGFCANPHPQPLRGTDGPPPIICRPAPAEHVHSLRGGWYSTFPPSRAPVPS